jgi:hypothetical protein
VAVGGTGVGGSGVTVGGSGVGGTAVAVAGGDVGEGGAAVGETGSVTVTNEIWAGLALGCVTWAKFCNRMVKKISTTAMTANTK